MHGKKSKKTVTASYGYILKKKGNICVYTSWLATDTIARGMLEKQGSGRYGFVKQVPEISFKPH